MLVLHDVVGLSEGTSPKFVKRYADLGTAMREAVAAFRADVETRAFPAPEQSYAIPDEEWRTFLAAAEGYPRPAPRRARG